MTGEATSRPRAETAMSRHRFTSASEAVTRWEPVVSRGVSVMWSRLALWRITSSMVGTMKRKRFLRKHLMLIQSFSSRSSVSSSTAWHSGSAARSSLRSAVEGSTAQIW